MHNNLSKWYYFIEKFDEKEIDNQNQRISIILRNYSKDFKKKEIIKIKNFCKKKQIKLFLSNNIKLALALGLDGVYIPSFNKSFNHLNYKIRVNFLIIGSAHNIKEIRIKELQGVKEIFLSSIFKKNENYLGLYKFLNISNHTKKNKIALGGVNNKNLKTLRLTKVIGFAGISFFK
tara:strand:+ start:2861 stop:3388 length:528 start_codon:yes stop_codon:yes gene_type:complete